MSLHPRRESLAYGLVVAVLSLGLVAAGVEAALHFAGPPIDGPFQLYNALRRIAAGQRGGVDFQFFHGVALPYLHFIPFRLFGNSFTSAELTRQILSAVAYPAVLLVFFGAMTRDRRRTLGLTAIVMALSIALEMWTVAMARGSLLGLRSALPTLVPAIWMLDLSRGRRAALTGAAIGMAVLLGTEQGLAILAAFIAVSLLSLAKRGDRRARLIEAAATFSMVVVTIVVVGLAIGGMAGLRGALHYNLRLVPMDQYWYFGSPPARFIHSWSDLPGQLLGEPRIALTVALALVTVVIMARRAWRTPDSEVERAPLAAAMLSIYGLVSCASLLGLFLPGNVQPCMRALMLVWMLELDRWLATREMGASADPRQIGPMPTAVAASLVLMVVFAFQPSIVLLRQIPHTVARHLIAREGMVWDGVWPQTMSVSQTVMDAHRGPLGEPPQVWSTYAGLLEARTGQFHPDVDYIIHALGPDNRRAYVDRFRASRPALVQTVLPSYSQYETWIEQTSWDFYADLLRNYRTVAATPWSIFWERLPRENPGPVQYWRSGALAGPETIDVPLPALSGPRAANVLIELEITYTTHNPGGFLPVVGGLPRYLVQIEGAATRGPVTLAPYARSSRFPVIGVEGGTLRLSFWTFSLLPGARFRVESVRASLVPVLPSMQAWVENLSLAERRAR